MNRQKIEEMASMFGVDVQWAINARLRYLRGLIAQYSSRLGELDRMVLSEFDPVHLELFKIIIKDVEKKRCSLKYQVNYLLQYNEQPRSGISEHDIERARNYPIEELLGVHGQKRILCPFHDDHNPSASIKNNKMRCFACNKTWNPIDYLMEHDGMSFIEAVKRLTI